MAEFSAPTNSAAEWSVLSHMLAEPDRVGEIVAAPLEQSDFSSADTRLVFATTVRRYYAAQTIDPLVVGELVRDELANYWGADSGSVAQLLVERVRSAAIPGDVLEHAGIVRRLSTGRKVMDACYRAVTAIKEGTQTPEEIGDKLSSEALQATAGAIKRTELLGWMDVGAEYVRHLERVRVAREQGIEIGVYTGLEFIDRWTTGIGPGELCFLGGEPGTGKTALAWAAAMGFSSRQVQRDPEQRVGTLVLSMEMTNTNSTARLVSNITGIDGTRLREGDVSDRDMRRILTEWKNRENLPIRFNFASNFRLSQMRALISEAIRLHNVGFVVIDHFKMIDTDRRHNNPNQEDDDKVRFIKESICKDLNVAVMCLAHTTKLPGGEARKPRMSDLRGSGMIAAFADFIALAWRPAAAMSEEERIALDVPPDDGDFELIWEKNRYGERATAPYHFNAPLMRVRPR